MPMDLRGNSRTRVGALVAMLAVPLFGTTTRRDEDVIRTLNAGYVRAFLTSDADWYDRHITADFTCIVTTGAVVDRATFLANARMPHEVVAYDLSDITVRIHGDAALISALGAWTRKDGTTGRTRYTDVWVREHGSWKAVSAQLNAVRD